MFGKFKKKEGTTAGGKSTAASNEDVVPEKAPKKADNKGTPARRTVAKPNGNDVVQKNTQVLYRLNYAVKQHPMEPSRSTELVPLTKDFDDMRKQLRTLVQAAKKYQKAMEDVAQSRSEFFTQTAKLAEKTPLADALSAKKVVLGESLVTLNGKLNQASEQAVTDFQSNVLDYIMEWEAILSKKIDEQVKYTAKLNKNLKHYEAKVEKLRKNVALKEEKGKLTPAMSEKLERNEGKLKDSWKEYEETATQTCHLLEEATRKGWKDLHPVVKAMLAFEGKRDDQEHDLWASARTNIQDKIAHAVETHDVPLPASAFSTEIVLISRRPTGSADSDDLDLSDEDLD